MSMYCLLSSEEEELHLFLLENGFFRVREIGSVEALLEELSSLSLFAVEELLLLRVDVMSTELQQVTSEQPCLIFAKQIKKKISTSIHWMDRRKSLPWDRKERLFRIYKRVLEKEGMWSETGFFEELYDRVEEKASLFSKEMDKLLLYCSGKPCLRVADLDLLSIPKREMSEWQQAHQMLYEQFYTPFDPDLDLLLFFSKIRHEIHLALEISSGVWDSAEPSWKTKKREKLKPQVMELGRDYFCFALQQLFELEIELKSISISSSLLYDRFYFALLRYKRASWTLS